MRSSDGCAQTLFAVHGAAERTRILALLAGSEEFFDEKTAADALRIRTALR